MKHIINSIREYLHYRKLFFRMEDIEVINYVVTSGTIAEYAQAHALDFSLDELQLIKSFMESRKASSEHFSKIADVKIPTCK